MEQPVVTFWILSKTSQWDVLRYILNFFINIFIDCTRLADHKVLSKPLVSYQYHTTFVLERYPCYHAGCFDRMKRRVHRRTMSTSAVQILPAHCVVKRNGVIRACCIHFFTAPQLNKVCFYIFSYLHHYCVSFWYT